MTDVVAIAQERKRSLQAEIKRLDNFIHMAEALVKYGQGLDRPVREADPAAPMALLSEVAPRPTRDRDDAAAKAESDSDGLGDHFNFFRPARSDDELVLTPAGSGDDAVLQARIGEKLRQRRWMMGMTKKQLADKVGSDVETIQRYERGEAHIGTADMWQMATALGVTVAYFFEESDARTSGNADGERGGASSQPDRAAQTA